MGGFFNNICSDPKEYIIDIIMNSHSNSDIGLQRKGKYLYTNIGVSRFTGKPIIMAFDSDEIYDVITSFQKGTPSPIYINYIKEIYIKISDARKDNANIVIFEKEGLCKHCRPIMLEIKSILYPKIEDFLSDSYNTK